MISVPNFIICTFSLGLVVVVVVLFLTTIAFLTFSLQMISDTILEVNLFHFQSNLHQVPTHVFHCAAILAGKNLASVTGPIHAQGTGPSVTDKRAVVTSTLSKTGGTKKKSAYATGPLPLQRIQDQKAVGILL